MPNVNRGKADPWENGLPLIAEAGEMATGCAVQKKSVFLSIFKVFSSVHVDTGLVFRALDDAISSF